MMLASMGVAAAVAADWGGDGGGLLHHGER
jgi:hypothetical protein